MQLYFEFRLFLCIARIIHTGGTSLLKNCLLQNSVQRLAFQYIWPKLVKINRPKWHVYLCDRTNICFREKFQSSPHLWSVSVVTPQIGYIRAWTSTQFCHKLTFDVEKIVLFSICKFHGLWWIHRSAKFVSLQLNWRLPFLPWISSIIRSLSRITILLSSLPIGGLEICKSGSYLGDVAFEGVNCIKGMGKMARQRFYRSSFNSYQIISNFRFNCPFFNAMLGKILFTIFLLLNLSKYKGEIVGLVRAIQSCNFKR